MARRGLPAAGDCHCSGLVTTRKGLWLQSIAGLGVAKLMDGGSVLLCSASAAFISEAMPAAAFAWPICDLMELMPMEPLAWP